MHVLFFGPDCGFIRKLSSVDQTIVLNDDHLRERSKGRLVNRGSADQRNTAFKARSLGSNYQSSGQLS